MFYGLILTALLISQSALAQAWIRTADRERQFTINFPVPPAVRDAAYRGTAGAPLPARIYAAERATGRYTLTVVDYAPVRAAAADAVTHAAEVLRRRGSGWHDRHAYQDGLYGHHLSLTEPDGRRLHAAIYFFENRLYIVEGSDLPGGRPALPFVHSLIITHKDGTQLNLDGYNDERYNPFTGETRY